MAVIGCHAIACSSSGKTCQAEPVTYGAAVCSHKQVVGAWPNISCPQLLGASEASSGHDNHVRPDIDKFKLFAVWGEALNNSADYAGAGDVRLLLYQLDDARVGQHAGSCVAVLDPLVMELVEVGDLDGIANAFWSEVNYKGLNGKRSTGSPMVIMGENCSAVGTLSRIH